MSQVLRQKTFSSGQEFQIVQGDITEEKVDAIVNAANSRLQHGGGVAGVIVRKGGWSIQTESTQWVREHGTVSHAEPAYTGAGTLPCQYVIHAVGPIWGEGDEVHKLDQAVTGAFKLAEQLELSSVALPAISTGIFGFPTERAARVIYGAIDAYFAQQPESTLKLVCLTLYDQPTVDVFVRIFDAGNK